MDNKELSLRDLSDWLRGQNKIPKKVVRKETLMEIAGIEHLENHWSFIYLYFFNPKGSHGLSRLFVDTLQRLICEETGKAALSMDSFSVVREDAVPDEKGNMKRIDLLLQTDDEAIIIENKVYAKLYNRLELYWGKPNVPEENKRGVVLSLWPTKPTHYGFINITHERFAKAIEGNLPAYFKDAQPKALILLQDFIQNIYNVTHSMNEEELRFYFEPGNREKINRLAEIRKNVIKHMWQAVENARLLKPLFQDKEWKLSVKTKASDNYVYYTFDAMPDKVMLTLVYDTLWNFDTNCRIRMFLEIQSKEMIRFVENKADELKEKGVQPDGHKKTDSWWHFRGEDIPFSVEDLVDENAIATKIIAGIEKNGFYEVGKEIIKLRKNSTK